MATGNGTTADTINRLFGTLPQDGLTADQVAFFDEIMAVRNDSYGMRMAAFRQSTDPRRNIPRECGYPIEPRLSAEQYWDLYARDPIAARVVEVYPKECWQVLPEVVEVRSGKEVTEFEEALDQLPKQLNPDGKSWFAGQQNSLLWSALKDLDILSGVGQYGVLLIGYDDGADLREPVRRRKGQRITFLRPFPENMARIVSRVADRRNPRHGQPEQYLLTLDSPEDREVVAGFQGSTTGTALCHWSRLIHVPSDQPSSSAVFGPPRIQQVHWPLYDLQKAYGASGEGYWQTGFAGIALSTHQSLGGNVKVNTAALKADMENYVQGFQRYLLLKGMAAQPLAPTVSDPAPHIDKHLERICIRMAIPKRIFMGSERGELASSQDDVAWNDRVKERQNGWVTPRIIVPFVDRLIATGVLPEPTEYGVTWPDVTSMGAEQKATILNTVVTALSAYKQGMVNEIIAPQDLLTTYLDYSDEEAEEILAAAAEHAEEQKQKELDQQAAAIEQGVAPDPALQQQAELEAMQMKAKQKAPPAGDQT